MKVAIYVRVSTNEQTTENQLRELTEWADRAGHEVVRIYDDNGVSGAKGREYRKEFDKLLKGAVRREFEPGSGMVGRQARTLTAGPRRLPARATRCRGRFVPAPASPGHHHT